MNHWRTKLMGGLASGSGWQQNRPICSNVRIFSGSCAPCSFGSDMLNKSLASCAFHTVSTNPKFTFSGLFFSNGLRPVATSKANTPKLNTSDFVEAFPT